MAMRFRAHSSPMWLQRMFCFRSTTKNCLCGLFPSGQQSKYFIIPLLRQKKVFQPMELGGFPYSCFGGLHHDATVSAIMKFTKCDNMCCFSSWERMKRWRCWSCRLAIKNSLPRAMQFRGHEDLPSWAPRLCQSLARLPSGRQEQMWEEAAIIHGKYTHPFKKPFCVNHL